MKLQSLVLSASLGAAAMPALCTSAAAGWPLFRSTRGCEAAAPCDAGACARTERTIVVVREDRCGEDCEKESRMKRLCRHLLPPEPPRGETAIALPARVRNEFARLEDETDRESESATQDMESRVKTLEQDLTRLTLVVEQIAESQKKGQEDMTRMSLILEKLAERVQ
jgi:hypothetical protein